MKQKVGLFFGSFDPIHIGHFAIIDDPHFLQLHQIWFVLTPENPFKQGKIIASFQHRYEMIQIAISETQQFRDKKPHLKLSAVEAKLKPPYYTAKTLHFLADAYPNYSFEIIMGEDVYLGLLRGKWDTKKQQYIKWHNSDYILNNFLITIYPRDLAATSPLDNSNDDYNFFESSVCGDRRGNLNILNNELIDTSSSQIRKAVITRNMEYPTRFLHTGVLKYIQKNKLYF